MYNIKVVAISLNFEFIYKSYLINLEKSNYRNHEYAIDS